MKKNELKFKKMPIFHTDEEAEHFVDTADLSEYDLSQMIMVKFDSVLVSTNTSTKTKEILPAN